MHHNPITIIIIDHSAECIRSNDRSSQHKHQDKVMISSPKKKIKKKPHTEKTIEFWFGEMCHLCVDARVYPYMYACVCVCVYVHMCKFVPYSKQRTTKRINKCFKNAIYNNNKKKQCYFNRILLRLYIYMELCLHKKKPPSNSNMPQNKHR